VRHFPAGLPEETERVWIPTLDRNEAERVFLFAGNSRVLNLVQTTLDMQLVQDLHRAYQNGRPIAEVIAKLTRVSLPGVMEYGCLRWAFPNDFPPLPSSAIQSPIGQALLEVRSELGLRHTGSQKTPPRDTHPREVEFYVVGCESDIKDNKFFGEYLLRFEFSAKHVGFGKKTAVALQAALEEMATNVVNHADSPVPALAGYQATRNTAQFCVVDVGSGVLHSLRANPAYAHLSLHSDAIRTALHNGVSCVTGDIRRGNGFNSVFKALAEQWGRLRFRSGEGLVAMDGMALDADHGKEQDLPYLNGFQVAISCLARAPASK
jgi:hypothetical protein